MPGDDGEERRAIDDWEQRVERAREANVALYLDNPSASAANILVVFEATVEKLRRQRQDAYERRLLREREREVGGVE